ncbi:hypothetical protein QBC36DRAFT_327734 [Triangularia setosa]|uniref:Sacsin/Nov domain-containing protein n=1 Tax=Triangularia setosa TaxID=2587417 RepID=A0AAN6W846_9PEZI|nr:hypothetical protein QBC36DRAFT_327734 [Podospora setosa]
MTISRQQAEDLVQSIADHHGHVDGITLATLNTETRKKIERALLAKDKLIGQTVITLAKELYSKDVRFIFELIQNADDNCFDNAKSSGQDPHVSFRVYHDKIIVECNENGFSEKDLRAICSVGQSSKQATQGYVGEKGIGFKSVFKVAWKVHIQSDPFSFCFTHRPGDSGMGMISPEWYSSQNSTRPPRGITRMTFTLHSDNDQQLQAAQRHNIVNEFENFQPAMLLFLKKLKRIEVHFFDVDGNKERDLVMSLSEPGNVPHRATITTTTTFPNCEPETFSYFYHVTKFSASGLTRNENRKYSPGDEASKAYSQANVVLAFPLTGQSVPIIKPQDIFAFLPIRKIGFNFLIHTDFVTMANREDIVTSSERNRGLRRFLADAFVLAALEMCEHPQLRFQWMRYLPLLSGNHWDPFWSGFTTLLEQRIAKANVIVPFEPESSLRSLTELKQWMKKTKCLDRHNRPVFNDLPRKRAKYLSLGYEKSDLALLEAYGMNSLSWEDLVSRAEADLESYSSKMKSPKTDAEWHSLAANILQRALNNSSDEYEEKIKALPLLPLSDRSWVSIKDEKVYFPTTTEGFSIPAVLELRLIQANAAAHPERNALFLALGVTFESSTSVRLLVLNYHSNKWPPTLNDSMAMLRFLYLTHPENAPTNIYGKVSVMSSTLSKFEPADSDVYFRDDSDPYGPAALGLKVQFLHQNYLQDPPQTLEDVGRAGPDPSKGWRDWLEQHIGIRTRLRIATKDDSDDEPALTKEILNVAEHQPTKFLGLLHHLWAYEGEELATNEAICKLLGELEVLCEGGIQLPLEDTILPTPKLRELSKRFLESSHDFKFLELETSLPDTIGGWVFLARLNVIIDDELRFYLGMLQAVSEEDVQEPARILRLYAAIQAKCLMTDDISETREFIRDFCSEESFIYIPSQPRTPSKWVRKEQCVLDAPEDMTCLYPLDALYDQAFSDDANVSLPMVKTFLHDTIDIPSCSWACHVAELKHLKAQDCADVARITAQYKRLQKSMTSKADDIETLKGMFAKNGLVFQEPCNADKPAWYSPADCVWSTAAGLRGKVNLRSQYPELKEFFVDLLGVDLLNINMIYDVLLGLDPNSPTDYKEAKTQLLAFSNLLPTASQELMKTMQSKKLLMENFLPVTCLDGGAKLVNAATEFMIIDRQGPVAEFRHQVKALDFDMEEVHDLEAFIEWAGLTGRYLSRMVREMPCLGDGPKVPVSNPLFDIRKKAHELLRVAKFFRSPRYQEGEGKHLYAQLRGARTWETDDISAQLVLEMNEQSYVVPLDKSDMYIAEEGGEGEPASSPPRLTIYIPHNETDQDVCIQHKLPYKLAEWMMTDPATGKMKPMDGRAVRVLTAVLNAKFASLARILEREGVHDVGIFYVVDGVDEEEDVEEDDSDVGVIKSNLGEGVEGDAEGETFEGDDVFDNVEVDAAGDAQEDQVAEELSNVDEDEAAEVFEGDDIFDEDGCPEHSHSAQENGSVNGREDVDTDQSLEGIVASISVLSLEPHTPRSSALSSTPSTPVGRGTIFTPSVAGPEPPLSVPINLSYRSGTPGGNYVTPQTRHFQVSPNWGSRTRGPNTTSSSSPQQYRELLSHMISAGQQLRFPEHTDSNTSPLRGRLPLVKDTTNPLWMFSTWEQGAAGELFILELLNALEPKLPGFCAEVNWTSKLRNQANVHPGYAALTRWEGFSEISDLQYFDYTGALTALLTEKGYLPPAISFSDNGEEAVNPVQPKKYYIEVKCTSQGCEEPFYMGASQYNKMKAICEEENSLYIIFRVFNLYTDKIDVRLFVNPSELERQGLLKFSPEKYSVKATS